MPSTAQMALAIQLGILALALLNHVTQLRGRLKAISRSLEQDTIFSVAHRKLCSDMILLGLIQIHLEPLE
jgi:hypothetical protein